ncbi:hypothetical protein [Sulfitobacter sabulilitoris]|uniref:Uncharacterized protein n=1 Tax=Sulfitobacter sabulilitoris TaxID=2562655 RepID=A0A5S3PK98_9RHOB|nr:hypothetical protein [Sulfitobacter sabulilitoris]TMM54813.1 hypothetical protein FDT80_04330 [Sulfitobacter sabulilitoris]
MIRGLQNVLYAAVAVLVALPPIGILRAGVPQNWFTPEAMALWALPLLGAAILLALAFLLTPRA